MDPPSDQTCLIARFLFFFRLRRLAADLEELGEFLVGLFTAEVSEAERDSSVGATLDAFAPELAPDFDLLRPPLHPLFLCPFFWTWPSFAPFELAGEEGFLEAPTSGFVTGAPLDAFVSGFVAALEPRRLL